MTNNYPRLIADVGGTYARFTIEKSMFNYSKTKVFNCNNYSSLAEALTNYLFNTNMLNKINYAILAVPGPLTDDKLIMINNPWNGESITKLKTQLNISTTIIINDFHALALSIPHIQKEYLVQFGGLNELNTKNTIAVVGPGTGLGMATLINHPINGYYAIPAEGGQAAFSPTNLQEIELWQFVYERYQHVSNERFMSGVGLQVIYEALVNKANQTYKLLTPDEITNQGINGKNHLAEETLAIFSRILGTIAANFAAMTNAFGGVCIGGGIIPKMLNYFLNSEFRKSFESKGHFHQSLCQIPVYIITAEFPAFLGASYALETYLTKGYIP